MLLNRFWVFSISFPLSTFPGICSDISVNIPDSVFSYITFLAGFEHETYNSSRSDVGWFRSLMKVVLALLLVTLGTGISLLFIYTGGHLDQQSIERSLPVLKHDVDQAFMLVSNKADFLLQETQRTLTPLWKKV